MSKFSGLAFSAAVTARMQIIHPVSGKVLRNTQTETETAQAQPAYIELLSKDSPEGKAHEREMLDAQLKRGGRRPTVEEVETSRVERLAALTRGWNLVTLDGQPIQVPFSRAAAADLYAQPELSWLRDQVAEFVDNLGNFPGGAKKTSKPISDTSST